MQPSPTPGRPASRPARRTGAWRRSLAVAAAAAIGVAASVAAAPSSFAAESYFCADDTQPYLPVAAAEALAPGTPVHGLSVTEGTTPSSFAGTYIGFIDNGIGINKDLLLFRLSSPVIDGTSPSGLKPAGIWAGMSGSPVYDEDNRLIGAVSYSLNSDNLPIAGVTPAEYMKAIGSTAVSPLNRVRVTEGNLKVTADGARVAGTSLAGASLTQARVVKVAGGAGSALNAFANRTLARTPRAVKDADFLRSGDFLPAAAMSAGVTEPLVAGGTIAALYGTDDLVAGAVGTVTATCTIGDTTTVWAFGHPMAQRGRTAMYMTNASTAMIVPDGTGAYGSYKQVSEFGAPLGMVTEDRAAGIRGTVGATSGFAINVAVQNPAGAQVGSYHGDLSYQDLTASALSYLIGSAAFDQLDSVGAGTGEVTWTIAFDRADGSPAELTNNQVVASTDYFLDDLGGAAANDAFALTSNPFEDITLTRIDVTVKLLSADSLTYRADDVQVRGKDGVTWSSLDGARLKAGGTYSVRPQYQVMKNGRTGGTVTGAVQSVKLSAKARKSGWILFSGTNASSEQCTTLPDGSIECVQWDTDAPEYADFDELLAALDEEVADSSVDATLRYRKTSGSRTEVFTWTGPGVVTGSARSSFSIRK